MTCFRRSIGDVLIDQERPSCRRWARAWQDRALRVSNSWPQKSQRTVGGDCTSVQPGENYILQLYTSDLTVHTQTDGKMLKQRV